jgi:uncharacterized protein YifN (PemK superfamily)
MALPYSPKVGEVLECDFGDFPKDGNGKIDQAKLTLNGRMPPEMVKNRLVVVLNSKFNGACLVVPISSLKDQDKITRKWHVRIDPKLIDGRPHFTPKDSWAKAEHVQHVSKDRLSKIQGGKSQYLPREVVTLIQTAVIRAIGAQSLLPKPDAISVVSATPVIETAAESPAAEVGVA